MGLAPMLVEQIFDDHPGDQQARHDGAAGRAERPAGAAARAPGLRAGDRARGQDRAARHELLDDPQVRAAYLGGDLGVEPARARSCPAAGRGRSWCACPSGGIFLMLVPGGSRSTTAHLNIRTVRSAASGCLRRPSCRSGSDLRRRSGRRAALPSARRSTGRTRPDARPEVEAVGLPLDQHRRPVRCPAVPSARIEPLALGVEQDAAPPDVRARPPAAGRTGPSPRTRRGCRPGSAGRSSARSVGTTCPRRPCRRPQGSLVRPYRTRVELIGGRGGCRFMLGRGATGRGQREGDQGRAQGRGADSHAGSLSA